MGLIRKETSHVNRSSRTPAGNRWKHEHLRLIWTMIPRSFVIVLLLMVLSVGVASAHETKQSIAKKTAVKKKTVAVAVKAKASPKPKTVKASAVAKRTTTKKTVASQTTVKKASPKAAVVVPKGKPDQKYVRKVIKGVTIYAYAPPKKKNSKKKAVVNRNTSTGTIATVGRTIAVDPKQIPLGWWVYVEGMGYRKAEDVGGAIKGKKIDVYVSSYYDAIQFGVKKNRTIYVIGPTLPKVATVTKPKTTAKPSTDKPTS